MQLIGSYFSRKKLYGGKQRLGPRTILWIGSEDALCGAFLYCHEMQRDMTFVCVCVCSMEGEKEGGGG